MEKIKFSDCDDSNEADTAQSLADGSAAAKLDPIFDQRSGASVSDSSVSDSSALDNTGFMSEPAVESSEVVLVADDGAIRKGFLHPSFRKRQLFWGSILLLLSGCAVALTAYLGRPPQTEALAEVSIQPVETLSVEPVSSYEESRNYTGELMALNKSELSFERPGTVTKITVEAGEWVQAGNPLASLDVRNLQASRQELLAKRAQAVAQLEEMLAGPRVETIAAAAATVRTLSEELELAQKISSRRAVLYQEGAISLEQLDEANAEVSTLQARLDEAKSQRAELEAGTRSEQIEAQNALIQQFDANLANLDIDLDKSTLFAPFAGKVSARLLDQGSTISAGQPVLTLVEDDRLEAHIGIPATAAPSVRLGSLQNLQVGEKTFQAKVISILPELDSATRTLTVVLSLDKTASKNLVPGQVANLSLSERVAAEGYWLPTTALIGGDSGLWSCYALGEISDSGAGHSDEGPAFQVERRDLEILYTESDRVFVRGTLQPGDQVIINGNHRLVPGQWVSPSR